MRDIKLENSPWSYDDTSQLGEDGGFGTVFAGKSETGEDVAIKRLHADANWAAHRELRIADNLLGRPLKHVIRVLDAGLDQDSGSYFIVMERAEHSLQAVLDKGTQFNDRDAATLLLEIVDGLLEIPNIVHRDLKPSNVLFHDGRWKIADFGIARFVEEVTSTRTLRSYKSAFYAAPEQWQNIRATAATDVYALGCIGYALLTGNPPFDGDTREDLRHHHLSTDPPPLSTTAPQLSSLLMIMLRKNPDTRPALARVKDILLDFIQRSQQTQSDSFASLASIGAALAQQNAQADAEAARSSSNQQNSADVAAAGLKIIRDLSEQLVEKVRLVAPTAQIQTQPPTFSVRLGSAELQIVTPHDSKPLQTSFALLAGKIALRQTQPFYQWSSSLWYLKTDAASPFRWYEVSYFAPMNGDNYAPYDLMSNPGHAATAAAPGLSSFQIAWGPRPIDDENAEEFFDRWAAMLAKAASGQISYPRSLPLAQDYWRK
jgi:serine/threonine-protein kinase